MFGIGVPELILILVVGLIVFGPGKLPEMGRSLGKGIREFRKASNALTAAINAPEPPPAPTQPAAQPAPAAQAVQATTEAPAAAPTPTATPTAATAAAAVETHQAAQKNTTENKAQ